MTRMSLGGIVRISLPLVVLGLTACGDAETRDRRGYTKAPLEVPGAFIRPEPDTEMSRLGEPRRPRVVDLILSDTAAGQPRS